MGPLHGLRVLDLCTEAGVYCTKLLTDLGAQVIKVEPLDGSPERRRPPFFKGDAASSLSFLHYNRNELSVTLGLALDEGRRLFHELVKASDILVEDGLSPQLGLNYDAMRQINPSLVYASITGYGSTGPRAGWAYSDLSTQATSGIMYRIGFPEDPPNSMGAEFAYHQASGHATVGILTAVLGRDAGGEGRHVDVSIQESMSIMQYDALPTYITRGVLIKRAGHGQGSSGKRYRRIWDTKKGLVRFQLVSQTSDREWPLLLDWMAESGAGGELRDERWNDSEERTAHLLEIEAVIDPWFRGIEARTLMHQGQDRGVMIMAFNTVGDLLDDPQLVDGGFLRDIDYGGEALTDVGPPYRFSETPAEVAGSVPELGEHNREVYLGVLGLSDRELSRLEQAGVV